MSALLTKRAVLLFKIEDTPGVDPLPTATDDAMLVSEPSYTTDPQVLERDYVSNTLSKWEHIIGRVVAGYTFTCELKGNGLQNSGLTSEAPMLARLFRACGYALTSMDGSGETNLSDVIPLKTNARRTDVTWTNSGTVTVDNPVLYTIEVVTGGIADGATAEVLITCNNNEEDDLSAAVAGFIQTGTSLSLGAKGGTITPAVIGELTAGDIFQVQAFPTGNRLQPISDNHEQGTLYLYMDGKLHKGHRSMGTFTIEAAAGDFARVTFNFTATYVEEEDTAIPLNVDYEDTLPPQVELSLLSWGGATDLFAENWSFDAGNEIFPRMDVNAPQGFIGSRLGDRAPSGGYTPEARLKADKAFWTDFVSAAAKTFTVRVGTERGNMVCLFCPKAQTSELAYSDRNGLLTHDKSIMFKRGLAGNDEAVFVFC